MDADFALVASYSILATLKGQGWICRKFPKGSWERRYYTSVESLRSSNEHAWQTYLQLVGWSPGVPSSDRRLTLKRVFGGILKENGIDLFPL